MTTNISTSLLEFFTEEQARAFAIDGDRASAGGVCLELGADGIIRVASVADEWLKGEVARLSQKRAVWAATSFLKVRHFATPEQIAELARSGKIYDKDYYKRRGGGSPYVNYPMQEDGFDGAAAFRILAKEIVACFHPSTALDCGCATGVLVKELQDLGVEASGIDISEYATDNAITHAVYRSPGDQMPFKDESFDLVISQDFMEHIAPDMVGGVLREQARVLRETGRIAHFIPFEPHDTPRQNDVHLCEASRAWWLTQFNDVGLRVEQTPPDTDQWDLSNGLLYRYFVLRK
ncbi:MAG: class I SAM-dependent methyltransferase [Pseudomonadota bacterium]